MSNDVAESNAVVPSDGDTENTQVCSKFGRQLSAN